MARVPVPNSVVARNQGPTSVIDAYRQGGWRAAANAVLNAPDSGIGPLAVVSKAGAAPLKLQMVKQAKRVLQAKQEFADVAPTLGHLGPGSRREIMAETPMVKRTLQRVAAAETGKPLSLVGHRAEARTGIVPGRGTFFSATPKGAQSFHPQVEKTLTRRQQRHGFVPTHSRVDPVQFKNPYVVQRFGGVQGELLTRLGTDKRLPLNIRKAALSVAGGHGGERWYTKADKIIERAMRHLGHDGLIYKDTNEIVDFAGTVKKGTQPTSTKAVEKAAESNIEKGPRFPRQF